ncbi:MAG: hypothetical protein A3C07_00620 [Candidatus Sungbacteria bacterium RIFCSPHIGHO2_02_FULL_47_11]|uniref:YdbS-like PH domain-containing protein n=1 Tax=Candidatus Sungbacteria bacterium RIFCSPHIGHO2_02_FULL_47_11 TaxID=1802270 RepID=A0A1G2KHT0_9BACT|nr:MAG: hypothetical protein A3C07_00620 [Candidatus Sungbacteria bacterium RIFCSPHIGHO2_02_FULL_47_11]
MLQLRDNEKILLVIRKHWFIIASEFVVFVVLLAVPIVFLITTPFLVTRLNLNPTIVNPFVNFSLSLYILVPLAYFFLMWMDYYLDMWVITNERLIDIEQRGLFNREVSEIPLNRIQDVTIQETGIIETLLHFGTIKIQTAGEREFEICFVPRLDEAKDTILKYVNETHYVGPQQVGTNQT